MDTKIFSNDVFFEEIVARVNEGEFVYILAKGHSMTPFICNNKDKVGLEKPDGDSCSKGNVVLAKIEGGRFILHRVEVVSGDLVVLRGDGNVYSRESCRRKDVLAEAKVVVKNNRPIKKGSFKWKCYEYIWPSNSLVRRALLGIARRLPWKKNKLLRR